MKSEQQQHHGGGKRKSSQEDITTSKRFRYSGDENDDDHDICCGQIGAEEQHQKREEDEDCSSSYSQVSTLTVDLKVRGDKTVEESTQSTVAVRVHHSRHGEDEYDDVTTVSTVGMELDMEEIGSRADGDPNSHVSLAEEDRYRYVLSSGRRTAPKEQAVVVTIDDEFEQYFGQLMI